LKQGREGIKELSGLLEEDLSRQRVWPVQSLGHWGMPGGMSGVFKEEQEGQHGLSRVSKGRSSRGQKRGEERVKRRKILFFRNEIKYDHGLMGVGLVLSLGKKKDFLGVDGQAASCCVWEAGRRRKS